MLNWLSKGRTLQQNLGNQAEDIALKKLRRSGLKLLERNYRVKQGEIDLVMQDKATLVFVEVRYRSNLSYGQSAETVGHNKQQRLIKAAQHYLQHYNLADTMPCRFDVVALNQVSQASGDEAIEWIRDAFQA